MRSKFLMLVLFFFLSKISFAQITWDKWMLFDSSGIFYSLASSNTIHQTFDKGYVIGGNIDYGTNNFIFIWVKFDSSGNYVWSHITPGGHTSNIWSVEEDKDSNIYVCGTAYGFAGDLPTSMIVKSDKNGNVIWQKTFDGNNITASHCLISTFDGGSMLLANSATIPYSGFYRDVILVKMDSSGSVQWSKTYGDSDRQVGYSVIQISDSGFVISGFTESQGTYGMLIIRTDSTGNLMWSKEIFGPNFNEAMSVIQSYDLNFIATGFPAMYGGVYGSGIVKLNLNGDTLWTESIGTEDSLGVSTIQETSDKNLIFVGTNDNYPPYSKMIKADSLGQPFWSRRIEKGNHQRSFSQLGEQTTDKGYVIIGGSNGIGNTSLFAMSKLDSMGFNGCNLSSVLPIINHPIVQVLNLTFAVNYDTITSVAESFYNLNPEDTIEFTNC